MKAPHFWSAGLDPQSREAAPFTRFLLTPFSALYATGSEWRMKRTRAHKVSVPVVCIGNLTVGGTGKTPIVATMRRLLGDAGYSPASLSRGYGGSMKGPVRVDTKFHTARTAGDEPILLASTGESWISRDRLAGAQAIAETDTDVILMDDGHQNPTLAKALSILVIDSKAPFGNGFVLPKGPLREPVARGLQRADAIVLMGGESAPRAVAASGLPVFRAKLERLDPLPDEPLIAFAGIGNPHRFFDAIITAGGDLRDWVTFPNHHRYRPREVSALQDLAHKHDAKLVTTEKDYVRLSPQERVNIVPIKVRAVFEDEQGFLSFVITHLEEAGT